MLLNLYSKSHARANLEASEWLNAASFTHVHGQLPAWLQHRGCMGNPVH